MKEYRCPYCGGIMVDYDDSVRFACQYCKKDVTGWEKEFREKLKEALPSGFYNSEQKREEGSIAKMDREKVIKALECCLKESDHLYSNPCKDCPYEGKECIDRMKADALALLKEQEDMGKELTDAIELIHKKNERIKKLEEQIETITKWRANAGAFD